MAKTMDKKLSIEINKLLEKYSYQQLKDRILELEESNNASSNILTVISNAGIHKFPEKYLRGEIYTASSGNIATNTSKEINGEIKVILKNLHEKLNEKNWKIIYLIPTGHPVVSSHIKSFIYRVRRINTIDVFYVNGQYFEVNIDHRSYALEG